MAASSPQPLLQDANKGLRTTTRSTLLYAMPGLSHPQPPLLWLLVQVDARLPVAVLGHDRPHA